MDVSKKAWNERCEVWSKKPGKKDTNFTTQLTIINKIINDDRVPSSAEALAFEESKGSQPTDIEKTLVNHVWYLIGDKPSKG